MNDNEDDYESDKKEYIFDDSEKSDFDKYNGLETFDFGESSEKPDFRKYKRFYSIEFET
ncbi:MAG: hypothetical protein ACFFHD_08340 [Promethearchaeota archaeon]